MLQASGFCYVNDIVLACLELLKYHQRVCHPLPHLQECCQAWLGASRDAACNACCRHTDA